MTGLLLRKFVRNYENTGDPAVRDAFLAVAAGFMALIVRVLKNAFEQAVRMKDELDYTV